MILAASAVVAMIVAIASGSKPLATAVAACGVIALMIFLIADLPDANNIGTLDDPRQSFFTAEAVPQEGFWAGLLGAVGLALAGAALATLTSEQIKSLGPGGGRKPVEPDPEERPEAPSPRRPRRPDAQRVRSAGRSVRADANDPRAPCSRGDEGVERGRSPTPERLWCLWHPRSFKSCRQPGACRP